MAAPRHVDRQSRHPDALRCECGAVRVEHPVGRPVGDRAAARLEHHHAVDDREPGLDAVLDDHERRASGRCDASHRIPHLDDPDRFCDVLLDWIGGTEPAAHDLDSWRRLLAQNWDGVARPVGR